MRIPLWLSRAIYTVGYRICRFAIEARGWDWTHFVETWFVNAQLEKSKKEVGEL